MNSYTLRKLREALKLTQEEYQSASHRTPEYLEWHRKFKHAFSKYLTERYNAIVDIGRPNHFDMSGFFLIEGQYWYFSVSDLRWFKSDMLVRTAKDLKDYTGGSNQYAPLDKGVDEFMDKLHKILSWGNLFRTSQGAE